MNEFTMGGAWSLGFQFVSRGTVVHFLILVLIGIAAPLGVQYALIGAPFDASPMSGQAMAMLVGIPLFLLAIALSHVLQVGSYLASLRFGLTGAEAPGGAVGYGLGAGFMATIVVAIGYAIAIFGAPAVADSGSIELVLIVLMLPLIFVYSLFFISLAAIAAASIILSLVINLIMAAVNGYPISIVFSGGGIIIVMLLMSGLLFWLAARFSCVTAVMAQRGTPNVFEAIGESWRMTADDQLAIMRYLALIGFGVAAVIIGLQLAVVGGGAGGLGQGGGIGLGSTGELVLRTLLGIPVAFLSVILPAGIYQQLTGEETPTEVFE